ncbi:MAG: 1-acyl-sn-glycerol-3-phosphate acyltransferase [Candidatus Delongbacteria bacterium]|nr:1-acyl-sn-glycerol-3-phosphate acyltransferase [Candidatus Delongbacteria bacterium]
MVEGKENIPKNAPVIYAPNHQNALMDPLAIVFTAHQQVVFLARADIFHIPLLPGFFRWLKILPVYRIRDGKENLSNNEYSFDAVIKVLEKKRPFSLFPEAAHSNKRHLLSFKKGIPRIAFQAEEKHHFQLGIKIVPVGIYYSKYNTFRSILHVRYGKPIEVARYQEVYKENLNKAMLQLRDDMKDATEPLVINIRKLDFYDLYESVRTMYVKNMIKRMKLGKINQQNKFIADQITILMLDKFSDDYPDKMEEFRHKMDKYRKLRNTYKLSDQSISKEKINIFRLLWNTLLLILFSPVFLYGFINNILLYIVPKILVLKVKDKQFHSSIKFLWALFMLIPIYLGQTAIVWAVSDNFGLAMLYLLSITTTGMLAQLYAEWLALIRRDLRLYQLKQTNKKVFKRIKDLHSELLSYLDFILETQSTTFHKGPSNNSFLSRNKFDE